MSTELIEYTTAEQLAGVYNVAVAKLIAAAEQIDQASQQLTEAFDPERSYAFDVQLRFEGRDYRTHREDVDHLRKRLRLEAWRVIVRKIGIEKVMSAKAVKELREALDGKGPEWPEITPESIVQVAQGYAMSALEFLEEAIAEEYEFWRPRKRFAPYQRNSDWKLNRKIIRPYVVTKDWQGWRCTYHNEAHVRALDSIFHSLDGRGPLKDHTSPLMAAIARAQDGAGETDFFRFRCYHNGNIHLEFRRQDLLDNFNAIAGKSDRLGNGN